MSSWENVGKSDEWYTPKYIFDALNCRFDVDVASPINGPRYTPTSDWIYENSLNSNWNGFVWMNPPFGKRNGIIPWLEKFFIHGNGIALVPDRTSAPWFQKYAKKSEIILFISPKVKFEKPDGSIGTSPGTGTALLGVGDTAIRAISNAASLGLLMKHINGDRN